MAPSWQRRLFAPARVSKVFRDDAQLTDRQLAMYLQHHQEGRDVVHHELRHEEVEAVNGQSPATSASGTSSPSVSSDSPPRSRFQRAIFGARGERPFCGGPGCFAAIVGGCGGCLVWSLGCHIMCLCVAAGALAEQTVRHAQWRRRQRIYMGSSSEDDSSEDSNINGLDQDTIENTTVVSTVNGRSISQLFLGAPASDSEHSQCMICVEPFAKGDSLRTLPCLHRYHRKCIDEWLRRSSTCPICKHDVTETSFHNSAFAPIAQQGSAGASSQHPRYRRLYSRGFAQVARLRRSLRRSIASSAESSSLPTPRVFVGRPYT